jgi:hypothetical protein
MKTEKIEQSTNDAGDIIFTGSFHRVRRGNKPVTLEAKPPQPVKPVRKPARVARMLAFAHKVKQAIEVKDYEGQADAARQLGLTRARVSQLMDLTWLSPSIQEEILFLERVDGLEPLTERSLRNAVSFPEWTEQEEAWQRLLHTS